MGYEGIQWILLAKDWLVQWHCLEETAMKLRVLEKAENLS
jgi:hypothetical protein